MKNRQHETTMLIKGIPVDGKAQFKAYCAERGVTMRDAIIFLMDRTVKENRRVTVPRSA